jgi:hypothetical protein
MRTLGIDDLEGAAKRFEKAFRLSADDAAEIILRGVAKNARRVLVGADAHVIDLVQRILPGRYHGVVARLHKRINVRLAKKAGGAPTSEAQPAGPAEPISTERPLQGTA